MSCTYKITLPSGEKVIVPARFSQEKLNPDDGNLKELKGDKLINYITKNAAIDRQSATYIVNQNPNNFIDIINQYADPRKALFSSVRDCMLYGDGIQLENGNTPKYINNADAADKFSVIPDLSIFKVPSDNSIMRTQSKTNYIKSLELQSQSSLFGEDETGLNDILSVVKSTSGEILHSIDFSLSDEQNQNIGKSDSTIVFDGNNLTHIFYNNKSILSMPLASLRLYCFNHSDRQDKMEYFIGAQTPDGKRMSPKMYNDNIDKVIDDNVNDKKLNESFHNLLGNGKLDKDDFGDRDQAIKNEIKRGIDRNNKALISEKCQVIDSIRDIHNFDSSVDSDISEIEPFRDGIKIGKKNILVTYISDIDNGKFVRGWYYGNNGTVEKFEQIFDNDAKIKYVKNANSSNSTEYLKANEDSLKILSKGSFITYSLGKKQLSGTVESINGDLVKLNNNKIINTKSIKTIGYDAMRLDNPEIGSIAVKDGNRYIISKIIDNSTVKATKNGKEYELKNAKYLKDEIQFDNEILSEFDAVTNKRSLKKYSYSISDEFMPGDYASDGNNIYTKLNDGTIIDNNHKLYTDLPDGTLYFTKRFIGQPDFGKYIDIGNVMLYTSDKNTFDNVKYLVPKGSHIGYDNLLPSGNLNIGYITKESSIPYGFEDATERVAKLISKGKSSYLINRKVESNNNKLVKNIDGYYKLENPSEKDFNSDNFIKIEGDGHTYRIIDSKTAEYNTFNYKGELITVKKSLDNLGNYTIYSKSPEHKDSNRAEITKKELVSNIIDTIHSSISPDLEIEYRPYNGDSLHRVKAFIESDETGNSKIVINTNVNNSEQELLHEYLHLFLINMKYNKTGDYENLMSNYIQLKNLDPNTSNVEELFVDDINKSMWSDYNNISNVVDAEKFKDSLNDQLKSMFNYTTDILNDDHFNGLHELLTTNMKDLFGDGKLGDKRLVYFDSKFRDWIETELDKSNLSIKCN